MSYYDALRAKWLELGGGAPADKLPVINALTVDGPKVDVSVPAVVGKLMLTGAYLPLAAFSMASATNDTTHDVALAAAKMLMAIITTPNAPSFQMSDATVYVSVKGMMDAILAQETAAAGSTGFTQGVHDALMALSATTVPWWQANGYSSPIGTGDLSAVGLV